MIIINAGFRDLGGRVFVHHNTSDSKYFYHHYPVLITSSIKLNKKICF